MCPKDVDGIANSVDPDQTAVWSGSALFAQIYMYLSERIITVIEIWLCDIRFIPLSPIGVTLLQATESSE